MSRLLITAVLLTIITAVPSQTIVIDRPAYRSTYDLQYHTPRQVEWTIHHADLGLVSREPSWRFINDIPSTLSVAEHSDYNKSGYDRGHLCPASDRSSSLSFMRSTFTMSNICPQVPAVNRGRWKATENYSRHAARIHDSVSCVVIPVFLQRDTTFIGRHRLPVPHAFVKAIWCTSNDSVLNSWFVFNK